MSHSGQNHFSGFYEAIAWGERLGSTAADPFYCTLSGVAKQNSQGAPYAVANEFICGRLGLIIGLPVPPGVIVPGPDGSCTYISLQFGQKGEMPPPVIAEHFIEDCPRLAAGVIAFDNWIGNTDRHNGNLAYSRDSGKIPPTVFDHSHALFGFASGLGEQRLTDMAGDACLNGSCLVPVLQDSSYFREWSDRIRVVSDSLIEEMCDYSVNAANITTEECEAAVEFLTVRKDSVYEKITESKEVFSSVQQWNLDAD